MRACGAGEFRGGICGGGGAVWTGFAGLLRQLRAGARLTQEELAGAAALSPRSVSDLERGIHRCDHKETAGPLADALGLAEPARRLFVAQAYSVVVSSAAWPGSTITAGQRVHHTRQPTQDPHKSAGRLEAVAAGVAAANRPA